MPPHTTRSDSTAARSTTTQSAAANSEENQQKIGEGSQGDVIPSNELQHRGINVTLPTSAVCECQDNWTWSIVHKSHEVRLYGESGKIAHFHPNWSNGTAAVRGNKVLNGGIYYWEIKLSQRVFGTSMMFGIGTLNTRLHVDAFVNVLGEDGNSMGLSHKGVAWFNGSGKQYTKPFSENKATTIGLLFNGTNGTLSYYKDGQALGVAFSGLDQIEDNLYPIISSTAAKTEMTLANCRRCYNNLQDRCRHKILQFLESQEAIDRLPIPYNAKQYLVEEHLLIPKN